MASGRLWLGRALAVGLVAVAAAAPAFGADTPAPDVAAGVAHETAEHAKGGLPQLNSATYPTQIFWLIVTFSLLLILMSKVALPRVAEVLEARQEKITNDLEKATALKGEAEGVIAAYEQALADARSNAQQVVSDSVAAADSLAAKRQGELAATLAERAREADAGIQAQKQAALANIRGVAAEAAQAAVAKLAGIELDAARADAAVDEALKERA
ncbi:MAG: hypothetical protein RLY86_1760 [Pseudomonadota bacterium]|jgi:F-type H+-transporting ATPase subunit b